MDANLRPDLTRILPRPLIRRLDAGLGRDLNVAAAGATPSYLLDIERARAPEPGDVGFGLDQARSAARRLSERLGSGAGAGLHALQPDRVVRLLS